MIVSVIVLAGFGATGSPYYRAGPGPVIFVGRPADGDWAVTTVRVRRVAWFHWALAELTGGRTIRAGDGADDTSTSEGMEAAQTRATLVAAQLAVRRIPTGGTGVQVSEHTGRMRVPTGRTAASMLRAGDILLAAGDARTLAPLHTEDDLRVAAARAAALRVLAVPREAGGLWGSARIRLVPAARLAELRVRPAVSAVAQPLNGVRGPSAGLLLALARIDQLTSGELSGGRRVAGTGAIGLDGTVTTVAEIAEKVRAALRAQADVFLVPYPQRSRAAAAAGRTGMRIVPVRSVSEAIGWLCVNGGHAPIC